MDTVKISKQDREAYVERQREAWSIACQLFKAWAEEHVDVSDEAIAKKAARFIHVSQIFTDEFQCLLPDLPAEPEPAPGVIV
jgi:hypothetical protein